MSETSPSLFLLLRAGHDVENDALSVIHSFTGDSGVEEPLKFNEAPTAPGERIVDKPELPARGVLMQLRADTETIEGEAMLTVGRSKGYTIYTDEGEALGGKGEYPPPMPMLGSAVGF
jgi:hypothetical protein